MLRTQRRALAGRYELGDPIGAGGMGVVVDAVDLRTGRPVAVKLLRAGQPTRREVLRLEAEARLASRVRHPNVVRIEDAGFDGQPFVVMERLSGRTLRDHLRGRPMDEDDVRGLGLQVLAGLDAAHEARGTP